ncbi:7 transmembrane receptor (rhodopsin family) domain-containing protein [Ditylenchus destructor]|nr:7 transmembrane receptor (rhodopsin family) domain-containing protein [Ditylenchus destructor]
MFSLGLIFLAITVIGLIGNLLVIFVIAVNRQLHDSTNILICNLALADLLFLTFCVPITAYSYVYSWTFSESICYITVTLQYVTCYVSVWTLVLLAFDRYISITNPAASLSVRRGNGVVYVCLTLWFVIFGLNFPQMQDVGVLSFHYNGSIGMACVDSLSIATESSTQMKARFFYWGFNLSAYVLPLTLSSLFYFLLVRSIWKQKMVRSKSSDKMKKHATKMVFVVIITFGLCWFPQNMRFFLRGLNYPNMIFWEENVNSPELLLLVQSTIQVLAYANSCINPILYGVLSERFRAGVIVAFRRFIYCDKSADSHYWSRKSAMIKALGDRCDSSVGTVSRAPFPLSTHTTPDFASRHMLYCPDDNSRLNLTQMNGRLSTTSTAMDEFLPVTPNSFMHTRTSTPISYNFVEVTSAKANNHHGEKTQSGPQPKTPTIVAECSFDESEAVLL